MEAPLDIGARPTTDPWEAHLLWGCLFQNGKGVHQGNLHLTRMLNFLQESVVMDPMNTDLVIVGKEKSDRLGIGEETETVIAIAIAMKNAQEAVNKIVNVKEAEIVIAQWVVIAIEIAHAAAIVNLKEVENATEVGIVIIEIAVIVIAVTVIATGAIVIDVTVTGRSVTDLNVTDRSVTDVEVLATGIVAALTAKKATGKLSQNRLLKRKQ